MPYHTMPFTPGRGLAALMGGAALAGLLSCASVRTTPLLESLDGIQVASLEASLACAQGLAPGDRCGLVVKATDREGHVFVSEGAGRGKVKWSAFQITGSVVTFGPDGFVTLPPDPQESEGRTPGLRVAVLRQPGMATALTLPVRYDGDFLVAFAGASGLPGPNGPQGAPGAAGHDGMAPAPGRHGIPGGDGQPGKKGRKGQDGGPGGPAPDLYVRVTCRSGPVELLAVRVTGGRRTERYLLDPRRGTLTVQLRGGAGGPGGAAGLGGRGGRAGLGDPMGLPGEDGVEGESGDFGEGGRAGTITVLYEPRAKAYLSSLRFSNQDGYGRPGPEPVFKEEPQEPLW